MKEKLLYKKKSVFEKCEDERQAELDYAEGYKKFLDSAKTERDATRTAIAMAKEKGFAEYKFGQKVKPGDKFYYNNHDDNTFQQILRRRDFRQQ